MAGHETSAAPHDILPFPDTIAGRIEAELHYTRYHSFASVISGELETLVGDVLLIQSAKRHAGVTAHARITTTPDIAPNDKDAIDARADIFTRGAVLAAHVVPPHGNAELRDELLTQPVATPFPSAHNVGRREIQVYEAEMRHELANVPADEIEWLNKATVAVTKDSPLWTLVPDQDEFRFGYAAVRRAVVMAQVVLDRTRE